MQTLIKSILLSFTLTAAISASAENGPVGSAAKSRSIQIRKSFFEPTLPIKTVGKANWSLIAFSEIAMKPVVYTFINDRNRGPVMERIYSERFSYDSSSGAISFDDGISNKVCAYYDPTATGLANAVATGHCPIVNFISWELDSKRHLQFTVSTSVVTE